MYCPSISTYISPFVHSKDLKYFLSSQYRRYDYFYASKYYSFGAFMTRFLLSSSHIIILYHNYFHNFIVPYNTTTTLKNGLAYFDISPSSILLVRKVYTKSALCELCNLQVVISVDFWLQKYFRSLTL